MSNVNHYHLAILGAGPAGLSAAGRAAWYSKQDKIQDSSYILLEGSSGRANTIFNYQKGKFVMAEPGYLDLRSDFEFEAGTRENILSGWDDTIDETELNVQYNAIIVSCPVTLSFIHLVFSTMPSYIST